MAKVISSERLSKHTTEKYNFKVFPMGADSEVSKSVFDKSTDENFAVVSEPYYIKTEQKVYKTGSDIDTICDVLYNL